MSPKKSKAKKNAQIEHEYEESISLAKSVSTLQAKRSTVYTRVESILKTFQNELSSENFHQFKTFFDRLPSLQDKFDEVQNEIFIFNSTVPDDSQLETKKSQSKFDNLVHQAETLYLSHIPKPTENQIDSKSVQNESTTTRLQLPKLELPKFSGKLEDWRSFYNLFSVTVHDVKELSTVKKFQYLLTALSSEALDLIKGLDITEANYDVAWTILCQRYQCERRHVFHHYNGLLGLPEIKELQQIPNFITKFREHTQALEGLDHKLSDYSSMLTAVIIQKMSFYFKKRFDDY